MSFNSILQDLKGVPEALKTCLDFYLSPEGSEFLKKVRKMIKNSKIKRVVFIGHTYNYFASIVAFRYINSRYQSQDNEVRKICIIYEIDEFLSYLVPNRFCEETVFIFISKSGESVQIQNGIKKVKNRVPNEHIWGVSNNVDSFLASNCHFLFPIKAGDEEIMGTKSYPNTILTLYILARILLDKDPIPSQREEEIRNLIFETNFYGQDWEEHIKGFINFLGEDFGHLIFISKGASLSTANQASLNCMAYARTYGEASSLGLFLHGPFQIIDNSFRCVLIIGDETSIEDTLILIDLITEKVGSGKVILINNSRKLSSLGRSNKNVFVFEHTTENTYLAPIFEIVVLQYLFLHQARKLGVII